MSDSIPTATDSGKVARRRGTMRSFRWIPEHGDEISACPDCAHWHAIFESEGDDYAPTLYLREWHEADCPCWEVEA